ncbi:MAG: aminoglycoside phosphotransferase family protein [Sphingomonadaceae bacterium]
MMPPPAAAAFLATAGWGNAKISPLAGDASFRRYFRIIDGDRRAVLMDVPPPHEDPRPFIAIAGYLTSHGFAAPRIHARDLEQGLVLIEDLGDERMRETVDASPAREVALYRDCVDLLTRLHAIEPADLPLYDRDVYLREVALFTDWYCPAVGVDADAAAFVAAWDAVLAPVIAAQAKPVTVLRDYHSENIMLIDGANRLGLLDFQDALIGHPAYDLVSILQDARRDVSPAIERAMLDHYRSAAGVGDEFERDYTILGAQRNIKILGIFTRLWKRDDKPGYLAYQPRMWGMLDRDLAHPVLAPVKAWFDATLPFEKRAAFWANHRA